MRFWINPGPTSSILMTFLLSYCILTSISQNSLFEVEGKLLNITSLQGKNDDFKFDGQNTAKKLREVTGEKIPNDYIVVMKDDFLSSVWSLAGEAKSRSNCTTCL